MHKVILTAREMHGVGSAEKYRRAHELAIAKLKRHGHRVNVHDSLRAEARVEHGRWITDCECGAGNATDPEWGIALCFGCGAVHEVDFPDDREAIERELLKRPHTKNRHWLPAESVDDLIAENEERGVK